MIKDSRPAPPSRQASVVKPESASAVEKHVGMQIAPLLARPAMPVMTVDQVPPFFKTGHAVSARSELLAAGQAAREFVEVETPHCHKGNFTVLDVGVELLPDMKMQVGHFLFCLILQAVHFPDILWTASCLLH